MKNIIIHILLLLVAFANGVVYGMYIYRTDKGIIKKSFGD